MNDWLQVCMKSYYLEVITRLFSYRHLYIKPSVDICPRRSRGLMSTEGLIGAECRYENSRVIGPTITSLSYDRTVSSMKNRSRGADIALATGVYRPQRMRQRRTSLIGCCGQCATASPICKHRSRRSIIPFSNNFLVGLSI